MPHLVDPPPTASGPRLPIVAIDGPAGAGKSTAARLLASELGFTLIDTGAIYRSLALTAFEQEVSLKDGPALAKLCRTLVFQFGKLDRPHADVDDVPKLHVYCNGLDVTDAIRSPEMGLAASNVSKLPEVRASLLEVQRRFGDQGGIVVEGRDIGTVVFPQAEIKFFLTASVESRAQRRCEELAAAGADIKYEQVLRETIARDDQDMNRPIAPLRQAADARLIDSTSKSLRDVVNEMSRIVKDHLTQRSVRPS
jgi:cytidylate kinase